MLKITPDWQRLILIALLFFTTVSITTAQVKIGENPNTIDGSAVLEIESTTKGLLPPRLTNNQRNAIANPATGLLIYNIDEGCLQINKGIPATPEWVCIGSDNVSVNIDCTIDGFTGTLVEGQAITTQTFSVTVTNSSFSTAGVSFNTTDLTFSGVAGITVTGVSPASATLNTAGDQAKVTYTLSGTPTGFGTLTADIDIAGILTCSANTTVISASDNILAQIGNEADDPDVINSVVTVAQLNLITPALTDVTAGNETAYQDYIDANPNSFSSPATQAEVQAMVDAVNASQTVLAQIGNEADDPDNVNSVVTVAQLNLITPALTGVIAGNETAYQDYIDGYPDSFSNPATQPEVQAMITQVNFNTTLLANIGTDADNGNNANTGALTAAELNALVGVSGALAANEAEYRAYIAANAAAFSSPATEGEVQAMITQVNANQTLLANIGTDAAAGNNNNTGTLTASQLNALPNVSGAIAANETAYKVAIAANEGPFSSPATEPEVQAMVTQVNLNATLLANIGIDADAGNNNNTSALTAAELNALVGVSGALVANEAEYRAYIAANAAAFSSPATEGEVQAMITTVNAQQVALAEILEDSNSPGGANNANATAVALAQLQTLPLSNVDPSRIANYQFAINAETGFSNLPTIPEIQAVIDAVNATSIAGNATCVGKTISITSCADVAGTTINDDAGTADGVEYDWTGATTSGMANTSTTRALVEIGGQCWMRYDMRTVPTNYNPSPAWVNNTNVGWHGYYTGGPYLDQGRLYQWSAAMNGSTTERAQGVCPIGWHVPSDCEFMFLENNLGMSVADQELQGSAGRTSGSVGSKLSNFSSGGNNSTAFSALLSGYRDGPGGFFGLGQNWQVWTSTEETNNSTAQRRTVSNNSIGVTRGAPMKFAGFTVRCLKD